MRRNRKLQAPVAVLGWTDMAISLALVAAVRIVLMLAGRVV